RADATMARCCEAKVHRTRHLANGQTLASAGLHHILRWLSHDASGEVILCRSGYRGLNYSDPFGLCPLCVAYAIFEVGSTLYDLGDLAVTAYRHHQGKVSDAELALTATGVAIGLVSFGVGYGKASRELIGFVPGKWLTHFEKHGAEFGAKNAVEYLKGANKL